MASLDLILGCESIQRSAVSSRCHGSSQSQPIPWRLLSGTCMEHWGIRAGLWTDSQDLLSPPV